METRQGQIALFFIVFAIVVVATGIWWIASHSSNTAQTIANAPEETSLLSLTSYVEQCLTSISPGVMKQVSERGGRLAYPSSRPQGRLFHGIAYGAACEYRRGHGCVNVLPPMDEVESAISRGIALQLPYCLNLTPFYNENKYVLFGNETVITKVGKDDAVVELSWPVEVSQRGATFQRSKKVFSAAIPTPLGNFYSLALEMTNTFIRGESFNPDAWTLAHGSSILIRTEAPYPDWLIALEQKDWMFRFALFGESFPDITPSSDVHYPGCITPDKWCFENSENCQGTSIPSSSKCPQQEHYPQSASCPGGNCDDCSAIGKTHGESWCAYEGYSGYGADKVGSRHLKFSCIDGKIIPQSCRDYREELCVEDNHHAICRDNRWEDCSSQLSQSDCEDIVKRDCAWKGWAVNTDLSPRTHRCVPQVPPGLPFWSLQAGAVCNQQNTRGYCPLGMLSCPNQWSDGDAVMCFSQGDCGDSQNYLSQIGRGGFENTDYLFHKKNTEDALLLLPGLPGYASNLPLPLIINSSPSLILSEHPTNDDVDQFIRDFVEVFSSWKPCSGCGSDTFRCNCPLCVCFPRTPLYRNFRKYIAGGTKCDPYVPPVTGLCEGCMSDPFRPCSEYRCKSTGRNCKFAIDPATGDGICGESPVNNQPPLTIAFNPSKLSVGYQGVDALFVAFNQFYPGVRIAPVVYTPQITYGFSTNRFAQCDVAPLPYRAGSGSLLLSGFFPVIVSSNGTEHNVSLDSFDQAQIVAQTMTYLNSTSVLQIIEHINELYGVNVSRLIGPDLVQMTQNLLTEAAAHNYYLFHHCTDEFSTASPSDFFVRLTIP